MESKESDWVESINNNNLLEGRWGTPTNQRGSQVEKREGRERFLT